MLQAHSGACSKCTPDPNWVIVSLNKYGKYIVIKFSWAMMIDIQDKEIPTDGYSLCEP